MAFGAAPHEAKAASVVAAYRFGDHHRLPALMAASSVLPFVRMRVALPREATIRNWQVHRPCKGLAGLDQ
jgi:hypothetical protein